MGQHKRKPKPTAEDRRRKREQKLVAEYNRNAEQRAKAVRPGSNLRMLKLAAALGVITGGGR
jgi:hypothetical protein